MHVLHNFMGFDINTTANYLDCYSLRLLLLKSSMAHPMKDSINDCAHCFEATRPCVVLSDVTFDVVWHRDNDARGVVVTSKRDKRRRLVGVSGSDKPN